MSHSYDPDLITDSVCDPDESLLILIKSPTLSIIRWVTHVILTWSLTLSVIQVSQSYNSNRIIDSVYFQDELSTLSVIQMSHSYDLNPITDFVCYLGESLLWSWPDHQLRLLSRRVALHTDSVYYSGESPRSCMLRKQIIDSFYYPGEPHLISILSVIDKTFYIKREVICIFE